MVRVKKFLNGLPWGIYGGGTNMYYEEVNAENYAASCLIEDEDKEPIPTGILAASGKMIMRVYAPKPKFGFPIYPEDNEGYEYDTDEDFMYVEHIR